MRKLRLFFLFLCVVALYMGGCSPRDASVTSIALPANTVKSSFDLDETFLFEGKKLDVYYSNGTQEKIDLAPQYLTGFDTSTTGTKNMVFVYNGTKSASYEYIVSYKKEPSKQILTDARFKLSENVYPTGISRSAELKVGSVSLIKAISFTVMASSTVVNNEMRTVEFERLPNGWSYKTLFVSSRIFKVVLFQNIGQPIQGDLTKVFHLNLVGVDASTAIALTNIVITDGNLDYNLPDAED